MIPGVLRADSPFKILFGTVLCLCALVAFAWSAVQEPATRWRLSQRSVQAEAVVVGMHEVRTRRSPRYEPVIEFTLPTGKLHQSRLSSPRPAAEFQRGQRFRVVYAPEPPHTVRAVEDMQGSYGTTTHILAGSALVFLLLSGVGAIRLIRATG